MLDYVVMATTTIPSLYAMHYHPHDNQTTHDHPPSTLYINPKPTSMTTIFPPKWRREHCSSWPWRPFSYLLTAKDNANLLCRIGGPVKAVRLLFLFPPKVTDPKNHPPRNPALHLDRPPRAHPQLHLQLAPRSNSEP